MSTQILNPFEFFTDRQGNPLDSGYIYVGQVNQNAEANPIQVFWDSNLTIPAAQPLRTVSGYASRNGAASLFYVNETDYSILIKDSARRLVFSAQSGKAIPTLQQDLANSSDPAKGAGMVGWTRSALTNAISNVHQMLDAQPVTLWEFAHLVTNKPNPSDPATWDWSPALLAASATRPIIDGRGDTYRISATSIVQTVTLGNITFKPFSSVTGGVLLTLSGNDSRLDITIDADGKGITCVDVNGNRVVGVVRSKNIVGQPQGLGGTQSGCRVNGQNCNLVVFAENHVKGTSDNDSIPRAVTADTSSTGNNNTIRLYATGQNAGLVCSQAQVYAPEIIIDGLTDNGIYHLGGNLIAGEVVIKNCVDEPLVSEGFTSIDSLTVSDCDASCGLQNGNVVIGQYLLESSSASHRFEPFRTRPGNVTSSLRIGSLRGEIYLTAATNGGGIFQFATGTVSALSVDVIDLRMHWVTGSTKDLIDGGGISQYHFGDVSLELIDDSGTITFADKFDFKLPATVSNASHLGKFTMISSTGEIRVTNPTIALVSAAPMQEVSATFGPYILQVNTTTQLPRLFISTGVPTVGTWLRGDTIKVKLPFIGGVSEYRCTTGGTPGTWRATEWSVGRGITRPTLIANDVGVMFMDNNLDPDGKPIWWNGTAWVDATGAVV